MKNAREGAGGGTRAPDRESPTLQPIGAGRDSSQVSFRLVLIPVNPADGVGDSFLDTTLPAARETGASVVAMKVMGAGYLTHKRQNPTHLLHWALSQPVSLAIVSCRRHPGPLEANVEAAVHFQPMDAARMREMETGEPLS